VIEDWPLTSSASAFGGSEGGRWRGAYSGICRDAAATFPRGLCRRTRRVL